MATHLVPVPEQPTTQERVRQPLAGLGQSFFASLLLSQQGYNPDVIARNRGGIRIYQELIQTPYVKAALQRKKAEALAPGWQMTPASESPADTEISDFVAWALGPYRGQNVFALDLYQMLDCLDCGYSLAEPVWAVVESGRWAGRWALRHLKSKDPRDFDLVTDEFRNVVAVTESIRVTGAAQSYPPEAFVRWSWMPRYQNPYGTSDLQAAYKPAWAMTQLWNARLIFLERMAGGTKVGEAPEGARETDLNDFRDKLENASVETVFVLPSGWKLNIVEASSNGEAYEAAQQRLAMEVLIAITGSHLGITEGALQGAKAQGEVHADTSSILVGMVRQLVEAAVQTQIVIPMVRLNFGEVESYPTWGFRRDESLDAEEITAKAAFLDAIEKASRGGVEVPVWWVRELLGIPEPSEGDDIYRAAAPPPSPFGGLLGPGPDDEDEDEAPVETEEEEEDAEKIFGDGLGEGVSPPPSVLPRRARAILRRNLRNLAVAEEVAGRRYASAMRDYRADLAAALKKKRQVGT